MKRRIAMGVLAAGVVLPGGPASAQIVLEAPLAGWRTAAPEDQAFVQEVRYPASVVSAARAGATALISGRILGAPKPVATLVVNGVSMPLAVGPEGAFARPYTFGRGSNSVEVRQGPVRSRRQFHDAGTGATAVKLRVVLSWDTNGTDVDLHVVSPAGEHAWYGNRTIPSGGAIDVDVTTGYGPEIFAHPSPPAGLWQVYVNYYGGGTGGPDAEPRAAVTIAQVSLVMQENTPNERQQSFRVPLRRPGELTLIRTFSYP